MVSDKGFGQYNSPGVILSRRSAAKDLASAPLRWVDLHVDLARVVADGHGLRAADAGSPYQRLLQRLDLDALQRIGLVMHARAVQLMVLVHRVEDIALDEEVIDRPRLRRRHRSLRRPVADMNVGRLRAGGIVAMGDELELLEVDARLEERRL